MSWQDELRQLDEELAAGRLSAEDYRRQRDELLSRAASTSGGVALGTPPEGQPGTQPASAPFPPQFLAAGTPPEGHPGAQPGAQQGSAPFPPPFRWDEPPAESTRVMSPVKEQPGGGSDVTQVVRSQEGGAAATDAERTQVVPGGPRPPQQPGMQQPGIQYPGMQYPGMQQPVPPGAGTAPWQHGRDQAPPWGVMDLPPTTDTTPAWFKQGPEVFEPDRGNTSALRILAMISVVLVLIAISVGAYYLFRPTTGGPGPAANTTSQPAPATTTSTTTTTKPPEPSIAELPGHTEDHADIGTFADAQSLRFLTEDEAAVYIGAGAAKARLVASTTGERTHPSIFAAETTSAAAAVQARDKLMALQLIYGMNRISGTPTGVVAAQIAKSASTPATIRAHYAHKNTVVRIQVFGEDLETVRKVFNEVVAAQLKVLAADG